MKKRLYILAGFFFVALGTVGAFLPVLPTVPFLLVASVCFTKGSEKYAAWFKGTKLYKHHLEPYHESHGLTRKKKLCITIPVTIMMLIPMVLVDVLIMRIGIVLLLLAKYYYFIFRINTLPPVKKHTSVDCVLIVDTPSADKEQEKTIPEMKLPNV